MWLILCGLWAVFGCGAGKCTDGRRNSSQSGNGTDRGSPTVLPSVERGSAAVAIEAVGGGGLPRRTSQPRRRNNSAPREHFSPFVFSLPNLSGLYCIITKQSQTKHVFNNFKKPGHNIYITYTPAEFIIYYTSALLLYYLTRTPPRARASFFLFSFFSISFSSFIFSFIFSFILLFFSFVFSLFVVSFSFVSFFFFSLPRFLQLFRRRQRVSPWSLFLLAESFHNKRTGA